VNIVSHPHRVQPRFELGRIVSTPGALEACPAVYMQKCLARHVTGDWGCVCDEDKQANDAAIAGRERILSAYPIDPSKPSEATRLLPEPRSGENTLWIITEADRSATTFLLPEEY
jgi:hypothetical protein